jgi:hydrogenase-4 component E
VDALINILAVLVMVLNLAVLASSRLSTVIRMVAWQGAVLGLIPLMTHSEWGPGILFLAAGTVAVKGLIIPRLLGWAMREVEVRDEHDPMLGPVPSVLLGALAAGLALVATRGLPLLPAHHNLLLPAAFATLAAGMLQMVTRVKAVSQVLGYLLLENGIFLAGLLLIDAMPLMVEMGVLLDLFIAVFVSSIVIHHIQQTFSSLDTRRLSLLKD